MNFFFESGGQFSPAWGGQFASAYPGQFKSAKGGQFDRLLHIAAIFMQMKHPSRF
jgi:hypothetical protein